MADNVIKAVFASGRRVKTAPLWRYDHGIRLLPIGLELPDNYEMHFSNSKTGEATTVLADATGAVIPAEYLIPGTEVYAWIYLVGDSYGRTKAEIIIPIDAKAKPIDQEPTPEQQPIIEQAIDALNDAQDALEEATSQIIESGITPEEREKLSGIEAGAEVNVIEEVRYFDVLRQEYRPLPVTNKGVNLPRNEIEPENDNDVVYVDFEIDSDENVTLSPFAEPIIDAVNVHGQTVIARVKISNDSYPDLLPLIHLDGYNIRFAGFTAAEEKLDIWYDLIQHRWRTQFKELVDWDSADNSYVWTNQGSENSGKVLTVGDDGNVTPQDTAGGTYDYSDLTNKPQINSVTLSGNKSLSDLGIEAEAFVVAITESDGTYTADKTASQIFEAVAAKKRVVATLGVIVFQYCLRAGGKAYFTAIYNNTSRLLAVAETKVTTVSVITIGTYSKPYDGIPASDLAEAVQTSLGKADTAIQQHQDISGKLDKSQGMAHAGEFLVVGSDGNVAPQDAAAKAASLPMGHLDSTSTSTVMTAQVDGITELRDGVCVWLQNGVVASASGVTLNVNNLGAKPIYNSLTGAVVTTTFTAASTYLFVYNATRVTGGCWDMVYGYDTNTTYTPVKLGFGYATCSTAAATAAKTASLSSYALTTGGYVTVKFTNAVGAGATLNINSKGAKSIYYRGAAIPAGVINAGDTVTFVYSTYYHIVAIIHDDGIHKTEMNAGVQASLGKADTALQPSSLKTINNTSLVGPGNISIPALPAVTSSDNGKVLMVVNGAWAAGELPVYNGEIVTPAYNVTISLTNPKNSSSFQSCTIRTILDESDVWGYGEVIGTISSPTGSTEVSVSGVYGIVVQFSGAFVNVDGDTTCTGGVSKIPGGSGEYVALAVSGDGTAVIDQVDYDD